MQKQKGVGGLRAAGCGTGPEAFLWDWAAGGGDGVSEGGQGRRAKNLGSLVGAGRAPEWPGGPKPPAPPAQATDSSQASGSLLEQSSLPHPRPTPGCQCSVWLALLLRPSPWPPHPPFPHEEQSGTLGVGPNPADPTRASLSRAAWHRSFTIMHRVSVSPCGTGCLRVLWEPRPLPSQSSDAYPPPEQLLAEHLLRAGTAAHDACLHTAGGRGRHVP